MKYYSTNNKHLRLGFEEAVGTGLPKDKGLFMPEKIPLLSDSFFTRLRSMKLEEIGFEVLRPYLSSEVDEISLRSICDDAFSFPLKLEELDESIYSLELFHGPTLAFKDFGARFMARILSHFKTKKEDSTRTTILVATSGDTGSAVAAGFQNVNNLDVVILYPKGKVTILQEKQMTTLEGNIKAIAIDGTFDDCQRLVKTSFLDEDFNTQYGLTSANSINIARLLPQMIYYFYAYAKVAKEGKRVVFSVPSGNYGNLTAGILANRMGLPIDGFIAATNANKIVPAYLQTGLYKPKPSVETISNAMDVGDPSNFVRLQDLFNDSLSKFKEIIWGTSFTDEQNRESISEVYTKYNYVTDPHGAIGYKALEEYLQNRKGDTVGIFLETAHPVKFREVVEPITGESLEVPERLSHLLQKEANSLVCSSNYDEFKAVLERIL